MLNRQTRKFSMRNLYRLLFVLISGLLLLPDLAFAHGPRGGGAVSVRGYVKSNGTYVQPHMRSAPDGNFSNNWSTVGNVNPYTGAVGTKTKPSDGSSGVSSGGYTGADVPSSATSATTAEIANSAGVGSASSDGESPRQSGIEVPLHAKLNYSGKGWVCESGYRKVSQECVYVPVPQNAKLNYLGNDWVCEHGFRKVSQECVVVAVPQNAKLNYLGNDWVCEHG